MTFLHKLAQRLARLWVAWVIGVCLMTTCKFPPARTTAPPDGVAKLDLSPSSLTLLTDRTTDFVVVALTASDDTVDTSVNWTTSGGSIAPMSDVAGVQYARYRAPLQPGRYKVFARASVGAVSDSSVVDVSAVPVSSVSVSPASANLTNGQTVQLTATPRDSSGNPLSGRVVTWATSSAAVAIVNANGLVTSLGAGTATITATSEGQSGSASVTVTVVPVASVSVTPTALSLTVGQTGQLTATPRDASGNPLSGRVVTWATNGAAVASVNGNGLVTAQGAGTATITATSEGKSGTAAITVTQPPVPVASVSVTPATLSLTVGQTGQLTATPRDASGNPLSGRLITWTTTNAAVATVSSNGLVTGRGGGTATITATSEGQSGAATVTVAVVPVASVTVAPASVSLAVPLASQLTATTRDAAGNILTGRVVTWATSAPAVASVNSSGLVTARAIGTATITATSEGQSGTATVTVTAVQGLHPNEPAGAVPMLTWVMDFSNVVATSPETDAQPWFWASGNPPHRLTWATTVTDSTAPLNPAKVGRLEINPTNVSLPLYGNSIEELGSTRKFVPPGSAKKIYWSYWFKYLPGFATYAFQFKQTEMFYSTDGGTIVATNRSETGPWTLQFYNEAAGRTEMIDGPQTIVTGQWYHVEIIIDQTTWRMQMFVNGQPYIDQIATVHGLGTPVQFGVTWCYGGTGSGLTQLNKSIYVYHDALYMSYVP